MQQCQCNKMCLQRLYLSIMNAKLSCFPFHDFKQSNRRCYRRKVWMTKRFMIWIQSIPMNILINFFSVFFFLLHCGSNKYHDMMALSYQRRGQAIVNFGFIIQSTLIMILSMLRIYQFRCRNKDTPKMDT